MHKGKKDDPGDYFRISFNPCCRTPSQCFQEAAGKDTLHSLDTVRNPACASVHIVVLEEEYRNKMSKLCDESNEAARGVGEEFQKFSDAQKENIVEIDSGSIDFSSMKTMSLGGVTGEFIDLSV